LQRALKNIEGPMREAAGSLPDDIIEEYWGEKVKPKDRIKYWLKKADRLATKWKPSEELFLEEQ
jgi:hypothetical protein